MKEEHITKMQELLEQIKHINDFYHTTKTDQYREINRIDMSIISLVNRNPDASIKDLQNMLGVPQSTLSSSISRLCKKGILKREINENDSRSFHLFITKKGKAMRAAHRETDLLLAKDLLGALDSDEERVIFLSLLEKIVKKR